VNNGEQSGAVARGFRLGKLGLSLMGSYMGYQLQKSPAGRRRAAQRQSRFRRRLAAGAPGIGSAQGPAMKLDNC